MTSSTDDNADSGTDDSGELRARLIKRLVVAGGLVAILLGALALFDQWSQPAEVAELPIYREPVPVAPKKLQTLPVEIAAESAAPAGDAKAPAESGEPAVSDATAAPPADSTQAPVLPPSEVAAVPASEPGESPRLPRKPAPIRVLSTPIEKPVAAAPVMKTPAEPELTASPPMVPEQASARLQPLAARKPLPPNPPVAEPPPALAPQPALRPFSGFLLQAGIFSSVQRAEELHARLTISGVPSTVETRVQVGPFKTRQEAEAAQAKLRELGIESILLPPKGKR